MDQPTAPLPPQHPSYASALATPPPPRMPRHRGRRIGELTAVAVLTAALASGGTWGVMALTDDGTTAVSSTGAGTSGDSAASVVPVSSASKTNPDWNAVTAAVTPSVVSITVAAGSSGGEGSGVVLDKEGHILTNHHVVSGAGDDATITVTLSDGKTYRASIAGKDASTDLAVLTLEDPPDDLQPITVGSSSGLEVGDPVMAVGNPLGLAGTVTTGIVSALNRPVTTQAAQEEQPQQQNPFGFPGQQQQQQQSSEPVVTNAIQTSAAINPGNSGGALVNANGELVGINSSIASLGSSQGSQSGNIGIGFAIPVKEARNIADQLIRSGKAQHAYLGVAPVDGSASDGSATRAGAQLRTVSPDTPAAKAGLETGDVITAVNGERVESAESLVAHIREYSVGDTVKLTVLRDNKSQEISATLAAAPSS